MDTSDEWIPAFWTIVDIERPLRITFNRASAAVLRLLENDARMSKRFVGDGAGERCFKSQGVAIWAPAANFSEAQFAGPLRPAQQLLNVCFCTVRAVSDKDLPVASNNRHCAGD
jgi:hypothetical protein